MVGLPPRDSGIPVVYSQEEGPVRLSPIVSCDTIMFSCPASRDLPLSPLLA